MLRSIRTLKQCQVRSLACCIVNNFLKVKTVTSRYVAGNVAYAYQGYSLLWGLGTFMHWTELTCTRRHQAIIAYCAVHCSTLVSRPTAKPPTAYRLATDTAANQVAIPLPIPCIPLRLFILQFANSSRVARWSYLKKTGPDIERWNALREWGGGISLPSVWWIKFYWLLLSAKCHWAT